MIVAITIIGALAITAAAKQQASLPITGRSRMWDDLNMEDEMRHKRLAITDWQRRGGRCTLGDVMKFDGIGRRESGFLSDVGNQGLLCGSCWAFAATHAFMDSRNIRYRDQLTVLSTQYTTRCATRHNGYGCRGDQPKRALDHFQKTGIARDNCLPYSELVSPEDVSLSYQQRHPLSCFSQCFNGERFSPGSFKLYDYRCYKEATDDDIVALLRSGYVVITGMVGGNKDFNNYGCGVLTTNSLGSLSHAVVIVDFGVTDTNLKFWVIKNSWGSSWGECGYFRVRRGLGDLKIGRPGNCICVPIVAPGSVLLPPSDSDACGFSTCAMQDISNPENSTIAMSAATFAIESLIDQQLVKCPNGEPASDIDLLEFHDADMQVVAGTMVDLDISASIEGCATAFNETLTLSVVIDLDGNFTLTDYTIGNSAKSTTVSLFLLATVVISLLPKI